MMRSTGVVGRGFQPRRRGHQRAALLWAIVAAITIQPVDAHKPVTSKYTYSEDVYPIVKEHCGSCHAPGGVAPMSLLTYEAARPWAESIRLEITAGHMPPWFGDPSVAPLKDVHKLSPRDIDVVLTWVSGGTPPGPGKPAPVGAVKNVWSRGRPDVTFSLPAAFTLPAGKNEDTREFLLQTANDRDRFIAAADLLPGNASIVHDAVIYTTAPNRAGSNVLAAWVPGFAPVAADAGTGFLWRAGEQLAVRIHYKKTWKYENKPASDRTTVGLYVMKTAGRRDRHDPQGGHGGPGKDIQSIALPLTGAVVDEDVQALAVRTAAAPSDVAVRIEAVRPDGGRLPLGGFSTRSGWDQRYWLARPATVPKGTRIEVTTRGTPPGKLQLWLDVVRSSF
jgi:mono/diheme cytochrome c family protein